MYKWNPQGKKRGRQRLEKNPVCMYFSQCNVFLYIIHALLPLIVRQLPRSEYLHTTQTIYGGYSTRSIKAFKVLWKRLKRKWKFCTHTRVGDTPCFSTIHTRFPEYQTDTNTHFRISITPHRCMHVANAYS